MAQVSNTILNRQQRKRRLVILLLAIFLLFAGIAYYYFFQLDQNNNEVVRPLGKVAVPVVANPIKMGSSLSLAQMRLIFFDPLEVPNDALLKPFQFEKRIALRDLKPGEYLRDKDLSAKEAPNSFSGIAKPGTRIVIVEANNIQGSVGYLRQGDHVDVLAVGWSPSNAVTGSASSPGTTGPGQSSRRSLRSPAGVMLGAENATLVAEDASVLMPPNVNAKSPNGLYAVLQMSPGDAQATTLALGAGAVLRLVFRPFNDEERLVESRPYEQSVYPPHDYRKVEIIAGSEKTTQTATFDKD